MTKRMEPSESEKIDWKKDSMDGALEMFGQMKAEIDQGLQKTDNGYEFATNNEALMNLIQFSDMEMMIAGYSRDKKGRWIKN